jgi:predicted component of type VI protein secretion system
VLLRLPYGRASDPVSAFAFEELPPGAPTHEHLLWGNPALAVALLIGRAFSGRGWAFEPGDEREIGDLPAHTFDNDGERELLPCAEHALGEQRGHALLAAGLMPLMSHRHANAVTVMRVASIAEPPTALAGPWTR